MAYSANLAEQIRFRIGEHPALTEKEMFGGLAFMVSGNMAVGVSGDALMVRVGKGAHDELIALPGARTFDLSSRPMRGWIVVGPEGIATDAQLEEWIQRGVDFAVTLPAK